jgi:hypothetical protein
MAEKGGIGFFKYYMQKLKLFFLSKDILSFLLFLSISAGFWYVHALGKDREKNILVPIRYIGMPVNLGMINNPPSEISIDVKDQGIRLFDYSDEHLTPLTIDLSRVFYKKGEILINSDQLNSKVIKYLKSTTRVLDIHPDSILIKYETLTEKILPIQFNAKIDLAHQYMFSDRIRIRPNKVTVFGPKQMLDTMKFIRTECPVFKNLNDTISFKCKLNQSRLTHYSVKETKVTIFVEQFTERKVQIPITALNCPENLAVRTFPAFVNATYIVGLSQFKTLNPTDIQVYLDYTELKSDKQSKHILKVKNNSTHISGIRISPMEVEYILEQK